MINVQPFIDNLNLLNEYMDYFITKVNMSLPHRFYTKDYDYPGIRQSFIDDFTRLGWVIKEDTMYWKKKTFEQWLLTK